MQSQLKADHVNSFGSPAIKVRFSLSTFCRYLAHFLKKQMKSVARLLTRAMNRVSLRFVTETVHEASQHDHRRLVVGLGNPGMEGSRHSVGMEVLNSLATRLDVANRWRGDKQVSAEVILSHVQSTYVVLLRSKLLMNINGVSVAQAARKYGVKPEDIILVHDDLDKPLGKISIKYGGSARGHNGVRSCIDSLQTDVMTRLRVGIGRPEGKTAVQHYVLSRFSLEEKKVLNSVLDQSVELLLKQLSHKDSLSASSPAGGRHTTQEKK